MFFVLGVGGGALCRHSQAAVNYTSSRYVEKRQGTAVLQDASAVFATLLLPRVLECGCPLPLSYGLSVQAITARLRYLFNLRISTWSLRDRISSKPSPSMSAALTVPE